MRKFDLYLNVSLKVEQYFHCSVVLSKTARFFAFIIISLRSFYSLKYSRQILIFKQLYNAMNYLKQIPEATSHTITVVRPFTSHLKKKSKKDKPDTQDTAGETILES